MIGIDPEETAEALERDPGHQGAADLIRQMAARIAELEAQAEGTSPAPARLLDCGLRYEEQGEEVHPHPECQAGQRASSDGVSPATDQTAIERVRAVLETEAVVGRTALEYRGLIASALMADGAEGADRAALRDRIELAFHSELTEYRLGRDTGLLVQRLTDATLQVLPASVDRADVLRDFLWRLEQSAGDAAAEKFLDDNPELAELRRAAAETTGDGEAATEAPVCEGFQWIGQSFATCERCGQPAWEHAGEDVAVEGAGPFDNRRTVRPWKPGEADAIRAKWGTPPTPPAGGAPRPICKCPAEICQCGHHQAPQPKTGA